MGSENGLDILWGAEAIAKAIGRTPRQVHHMLTIGELPARKVGGRWCVSRHVLAAFFAMPAKEAA